MRLFVAGGQGLVGGRLVERLRAAGHEAAAGSRRTGVDALTGAGLGAALAGVDVVVDVLDTPDMTTEAATAFFRGTTTRLLAAEQSTGVRHHVLLSVVGADRALANGYHAGKVAQEDAVRDGDVPFSIVRATRFHEVVPLLADLLTVEGVVHAPRTRVQPVALDDVVDLLARVAVGPPTGDTTDLAGPEVFDLDDLLRTALTASGDPRPVRTVGGQAFGAESADALLPLGDHLTGARPFPGRPAG
ncbi:SDR family oxidoreductase [Blastococcus sp. TF02A-30]|uniref:SDR family oxidoreductase n=1 Tax=Blastococcus sp. TF02A-30 TaxID=2250580 RepID=UPI000DE81238|nr:SDR family oxidoreductase [Blastococcus sp. TF02A-30]RBY89415.1 NmrA family protein [Blastococcus sp. TF02A-30]